jgi:hypothetical protein
METVAAAGPTVVSGSGAATAAPPVDAGAIPSAPPEAAPEKPRGLTIGIIAVVILCVILAAAGTLAYLGQSGSGPLAFLAAATDTPLPPTSTPEQPTNTPEAPSGAGPAQSLATATPAPPTATPTESLPTPTATETLTPTPSAVVIGGADKIAFIQDDDIWVANLDGSDLVRLTKDGATKINLQWTPDGQAIQYISGKCVRTVRLEDGGIGTINCYNFVDYLKTFEISPDGKQVAASLDNQLYILPYDEQVLGSIQTRGDLTEVAECKDFAPYTKNFVKFARWSKDGTMLAMVIMGHASGIGSADTIQVIPLDECTEKPRGLDNFPPPRYTPPEYALAPSILNFGWDGFSLFAHTTYIQHGGFGNLYIYNMDLKKAQMSANPIDGDCCYRDPIWSPDGTHFLFAYQEPPGGDQTILIYLIPYGTIGTGTTYTPLPLPPITNPSEQPLPALRPAQ